MVNYARILFLVSNFRAHINSDVAAQHGSNRADFLFGGLECLIHILFEL